MDSNEESLQKVLYKHVNQPTVADIWNIANEITSTQYLKYFEEKEYFTFENTHIDLSKCMRLNTEAKRAELEGQIEKFRGHISSHYKQIV